MSSVLKVEVLMEGHLYKRSPKQLLSLSIDQRRYFLLTLSLTLTHHQHFHLSYFRNADENIPLGNIPMSHVRHVQASETENGRFDVSMAHEARVYILRCDNALEYSRWMDHLNRAMKEEGKRRSLQGAAATPTFSPSISLLPVPSTPSSYAQQQHSAHRYSTLSHYHTARESYDGVEVKLARRDASAARQWEVKEAMDLMMAGTPVTLVTPPPPSAPSSPTLFTPSILIYKHDDTPLGSLYFYPLDSSLPTSSFPSQHSRLCLHHLTDIFLGRQSRAYLASLNTANPAAPANCFSACTRVGVSLHVAADSRQVTSAWVLGINSVMMSQGQRKIRTKERVASGARRVTVLGPPSPSSSLLSVSSDGGLHMRSHSPELEQEIKRHPSLSVSAAPQARRPSVPYSEHSRASPTKVDRALEDWLANLGSAFLAYYDTFVDNGVDMSFLCTLTVQDLDELGVTRLHAKKLVASIKDWQEREKQKEKDDQDGPERKSSSTPYFMPQSAPPSVDHSTQNSIRSPAGPSASSLLAALSPPPPLPYFPPPPVLPQIARRDSLASPDIKRASMDTKTKRAGTWSGRGKGAATNAIISMLSALKPGMGLGTGSGHVSGDCTPQMTSNPLIAKKA